MNDSTESGVDETRTARHPAAQGREINDKREIFGWVMYDWANSAFSTTVATTLLGIYLTGLAQGILHDENGIVISFGPLGSVTAKSFFPFCVAISVFLQAFLLPVLGAIADYSHLKRRLMAVFCYIGVAATCLLYFITGRAYPIGGLLFIIANLCFGASLVFYNAFLPQITTEDRRDKISSRGYALGYLGGGLLLALNLALVVWAQSKASSETVSLAVRISLLSAGLWWGGFALVTFSRLKERGAPRPLPPGKSFLRVGFAETLSTFRELGRLRHTLKYLIAYLLFNDGIQTVIVMAGVFLEQELFTSRGLAPNRSFLLGIILMVQFVAFCGALLFERIARAIGTKHAILLSLVMWSGIVIYAYGFLETVPQAWVMAAAIALVLGGSQALSRGLFSRMIPRGREASFFGIYEISERGTSWIGPLVFGIVVGATNSYRQAILSLIVFFIGGMLVLFFTNTDKAIHEAGNVLPEEVATK
ncbi:MAG: transporter, family [Acidobacteriota bacterium]|jgi:UMF1 family MFS transporter|nr:transporter, family [Acidobacteriota bacterium]